MFTLLALYGCAAALFVWGASANADEGFYVASARLTANGMVPYRDYAYTQPPALPYIHGLAMRLTGFGVFQLRLWNAIWGAVTLAALFLLLRGWGIDPIRAALGLLPWMATPASLYFTIIGKTYGFAQMALVLGCLAFLPWGRPWQRFAWLALWGTLAVGVRLTMLPAVCLLWCGLAWENRSRFPWLVACGLPTLFGAALFFPFWHAAPESMRFWLWEYHTHFAGRTNRVYALVESLLLAPGLSVMTIGALGVGIRRGLLVGGAAWCLLASVAGLAAVVGLSGVYSEYAAPFWALVCAGAAGVLLQTRPSHRVVASYATLVVAICAVGWLPAMAFKYEAWIRPGYVASIRNAAGVLREGTNPNDFVIASMPEVPIAARRSILPELALGKFGVTSELPPALAARYRIFTFDDLLAVVTAGDAAAIVLSVRPPWSFGWSVPSLRLVLGDSYLDLLTQIGIRYEVAYVDEYFYVLLRRNEP